MKNETKTIKSLQHSVVTTKASKAGPHPVVLSGNYPPAEWETASKKGEVMSFLPKKGQKNYK